MWGGQLSNFQFQETKKEMVITEDIISLGMSFFSLFFPLIFFITYFPQLHFQCYPKSLLHPPRLPCPPTSPFWPWHSPVLGHIKFARPMGLSFRWWPTRSSFDTYAARDKSSGYFLVHIVVPPIGLQFPWVLSLIPPLGALWSIQ